jgi:toxin secretion/phage lysis holin
VTGLKVQGTGTDTLTTALAGGFASTMAYLLGGVDNLVNAMAIFMILDYVTGLSYAWTYGTGWESHRMYKGLAKKAGAISFVVMANQLDLITPGDNGFLRDAMIFFVIGMEGISIKENVEKMGFTAPGFIVDVFNKFTNKGKDDSKGA